MRLIGVLLLIAVFVVGFFVLKPGSPAQPDIVVSAPQSSVSDSQLAELQEQVRDLSDQLEEAGREPDRRVEDVPPQEPAVVAQPVEEPQATHGCVADPGNAGGSSPTLSVSSGHLLSVQWYVDGGPQEQSILSAGTWSPHAGIRVGAYWDYPDCPQDVVVSQAVASNGSVTDASNGFSRS